MPNRSRRLACSLAVIVLAGLVLAPGSIASRGSILPTSLYRTSEFGSSAYPADIAFVGDQPCALIGTGTTARLACGRRLQHRDTLDLTPSNEQPSAMDASDDAIDIAGYHEPGGGTRPLLVRTDHAGAPRATFGTNGVAMLDTLAPSGHADVSLGAVDTLPDGSTVVAGVATTGATGDLVTFVAKVTAGGVLDPTFGDAGVREVRVPGFARSRPNDIRVLDDGTILVVGWVSTAPEATFYAYAALLDATGAFVPGFGTAGISRPLTNAATTLYALPDTANAGTWPMLVSGSTNVKGEVKPYVLQLQQDGRMVATWGGPRSHTTTTVYGGPRQLQGMDIERLPDGTAIGAAEMYADGDYDSFVTRFKALSGTPDKTWSSGGFEPIDTAPGVIDDEYTSAMALSPDGTPWVLGASSKGRTKSIHLFRPRNAGSAAAAKWAGAEVLAFDARGKLLACGRSARRPCVLRRGQSLRIGAGSQGLDPLNAALLRPVLHVWSKPPRKAWRMREQFAGRSYRSGSATVVYTTLRLGLGTHEVILHRNGGANFGAAWSSSLFVRVR